MLGQYTTDEGYILTAYGAAYLDTGLQIEDPEGEIVYNCPCELAGDSYGYNPPKGLDWDEWQEQGGEGVPWSPKEWETTLRELWERGDYDYFVEQNL